MTNLALLTFGAVAIWIAATPCLPLLEDLARTEVHGWKAKGPAGIYNADTLYEYINGGAEIYRSFDVQNVWAFHFQKQGAPDILVDVFDMGRSENAFGAYHHDIRDGEQLDIGQGSEYVQGSLSFWKDRFFVSIIAFDETEDSKLAVQGLGKSIADNIKTEGNKPEILSLLPTAPKRLHYFHNHTCLNANYFIADDNLLELGPDTEGVLGFYEILPSVKAERSDPTWVLMAIQYPDPLRAESAQKSFIQGYLPGIAKTESVQMEDKKWMGARLQGRFFLAVFDAPSKDLVDNELTRLVAKAANSVKTQGESSP